MALSCSLLSSGGGNRNKPSHGSGQKEAIAAVDDGYEEEGVQPQEAASGGGAAHGETLVAVITGQQRRCRQCQRQAEKAEARRNALLTEAEAAVARGAPPSEVDELNERAREQEELRKTKTELCIALQGQVAVLERVLTESGFATQGLDEDPEKAEVRQAAEEAQYHMSREEVRVQRESAEEMSHLLVSGLRDPMADVDHDAVVREVDATLA